VIAAATTIALSSVQISDATVDEVDFENSEVTPHTVGRGRT